MSAFPQPTLFWCQEGSANIRTGAEVIHLRAGEALYASAATIVDEQGVVLPLPAESARSLNARKVFFGPEWEPVMLREFSLAVSNSHYQLPESLAGLCAAPAAPPPMPSAPEARQVAEVLFENTADQTPLEGFAERLGVSSRTIQRQFISGTGFSFSEWRAGVRVAAAAELLSMDFSVAVAANLVGFSATSSLTRAFRRHTGHPPSAFTAGAVGMGEVGTPPRCEAYTVFAGDYDIVWWVQQGAATLVDGDFCRFMAAGDTATLTANSRTRIDVASGSVVFALPRHMMFADQPELAGIVADYRAGRNLGTSEVLAKKMERARELLRNGQRPKDVGIAVGYGTHSAFSRAFKCVQGMTPREFQKGI
ncbi:MAG: AraC family transcriptional regulator [Corynebacterium sp.]|nr:AraC family transcriptional regulator [Corynebacterium sp.]